jgi:hypothetical protein
VIDQEGIRRILLHTAAKEGFRTLEILLEVLGKDRGRDACTGSNGGITARLAHFPEKLVRGFGFFFPSHVEENRRVDRAVLVVLGRELDEPFGIREGVLQSVHTQVRLGAKLDRREQFGVDLEHVVGRANRFLEVVHGKVCRRQHQSGRNCKLLRFTRLLECPDGAARVSRLNQSGAEAVIRLRKVRRDGENLAELVDRFCKLANVLERAHFLHARIDVAAAAGGHECQREHAERGDAIHATRLPARGRILAVE